MVPSARLIGKSLSVLICSGASLIKTLYSNSPIFACQRQNQILSRDRVDDVLWLEPQSLQLLLIEIDPNLAHLAAIG